MMNVQLLLLVTLAGPFCAFTHASPTARTTDVVPTVSPEAAKASDENSILTISPPASIPDATTVLEVSSTLITSPPTSQPTPEDETTEVTTVAAPSISSVFWTEAPDATTIASEPPSTDPPVWETAATTDLIQSSVQDTVMKTLKATEEVAVEDDTEGLSSGQVVGIVIGALLALVILIAVVIAVMRRMGKYSP